MTLITNLRRQIIQSIRLSSNEMQVIEAEQSSTIVQPFELPNTKWVKESVKFENKEKFMTGLYKGKLICITDRSFFPDKSYLILAAQVALVN